MQDPDQHPFITQPHRTVVALSFPVLLSLVAEPITGLVDTAFIARLGSVELAGLGAAAAFLSSVLWIFLFLGVAAHTEVAQAYGAVKHEHARRATGVAVLLSFIIGFAFTLILWPLLPSAAAAMGASGKVYEVAVTYLEIRLLGSPASFILLTGFGALRGVQDMRTPLWIAVGINALNILLDPLLIFGCGPVPPLGVAGAAWASSATQWIGALVLLRSLHRRFGLSLHLRWDIVRRMLRVGRDMVVRTASLSLFLLLCARAATRIDPETGAAHQAIRQMWLFTALFLDAYAAAAQSLVGYFFGAGRLALARRVAAISTLWSVGTGFVLAGAMILGEGLVARALVPQEAWELFAGAWLMSALFQPLNGLGFITDGIHWGAGDFAYLRDAMLCVTVIMLGGLFWMDASSGTSLVNIWMLTGVWISLRALLGVVRVWPGIGRAPLRT